jgi:glutamine synthetase
MSTLYPTTMTEAMPGDDRIQAAQAVLDEAGVKFIFSCWIDLLGNPKTKPVPVSELANICKGKGPQFAVHSVSMVPELGPADPDQIPIPDLDSLIVCPWNNEYAFVFADLFFQNAPYNVCPRLALKRLIQEAADKGYTFYAGLEPEFIVLTYDENGQPIKAIDDDPRPGTGLRPRRQAFGYDSEYSFDSMDYLGDLIKHINEMGWDLGNVVCEGAYSQFELDFHYTDILGAADRMTFLRVLLKEVAKEHGMFATFMPKPTSGDWRSGAHINHSIQAVDNPGVNLFEGKDGGWSDMAYNVVGGLIEHGGALTALACPTVNSYKGLIARAREFEGGTVTWAPTHMTYGSNNRSAMLRLPQARFAIENRASDMTQNFYFGLGMTLAASLKGIENKTDPGAPFEKALYDATQEELDEAGVQALPSTLIEAINAFDADPLAKEALGPVMHNSYSRYKHDEWNRYHEDISPWEVEEYLRFF